jgi:glycosyltransferase involved in cell wall biosynthesis
MTQRVSVALVGLLAGGSSGVARYSAVLTRALDEVRSEFEPLDLTLLTTAQGARRVGPVEMDTHIVPVRRGLAGGPGRIAVEQLMAARRKADLLHFFDLSGPLLAPRKPFVATIHDTSVVHGYSVGRQAYKRVLYPWALRRARRVIAVSEFAKQEAVRHFGADPGRITVIHSGPGFTPDGDGAGPTHGGDERPFLLFVGNLTASKNVPFLVRVFDEADTPCRLVLLGRPGDRYDKIQAAVAAAKRPERIELVHDASDRDVDHAYRKATALLLPSLYEGFAFTPLEAMARGCPVLASDIPAIREVSGDGAMLLPLDEAAWSEAIRRVVADQKLQDELRERGSRTVARYSWHETARGLCSVFLEHARPVAGSGA